MKKFIILLFILLINNNYDAQIIKNRNMSIIRTTKQLTSTAARELISFGVDLATKKEVKISIAIVDTSGYLLAFSRMDDAALVTVDVAMGKAKSAALLKAPSKLFEDFINSGQTSMLSTPNILPLQGGVPIIYEGEIIAAVGVSGADGETDNSIAKQISEFLK